MVVRRISVDPDHPAKKIIGIEQGVLNGKVGVNDTYQPSNVSWIGEKNGISDTHPTFKVQQDPKIILETVIDINDRVVRFSTIIIIIDRGDRSKIFSAVNVSGPAINYGSTITDSDPGNRRN